MGGCDIVGAGLRGKHLVEDDDPGRPSQALDGFQFRAAKVVVGAVARGRGGECEEEIVWQVAGNEATTEMIFVKEAVWLVLAIGKVDIG